MYVHAKACKMYHFINMEIKEQIKENKLILKLTSYLNIKH